MIERLSQGMGADLVFNMFLQNPSKIHVLFTWNNCDNIVGYIPKVYKILKPFWHQTNLVSQLQPEVTAAI